MRNCCKKPDNWFTNGSFDKTIEKRKYFSIVSNKQYMRCKVCGKRLRGLAIRMVEDSGVDSGYTISLIKNIKK